MALRLGLGLPQMAQYDLHRDVLEVARAAEKIGYDGLWVFERVLVPVHPQQGLYGIPGLEWPDYYKSVADPLVTLTLAAAVTERATLGTNVLVGPLHGPVRLARMLATLDAASGGRVVAGFGSGWSIDEYAATGAAPYEERGAALDELLDVCAAVWGPDPVSYEGTRTRIVPSAVGPKPVRPIPVLLAASNEKALDRVARRADGWLPVGAGAQQLSTRLGRLRELAERHGRDPRTLGCTVRANVQLSDGPLPDDGRMPFSGNMEQVVEDVVATAGAGADEVVLELQTAARDGKGLVDLAATFHRSLRGNHRL